jgi:D-beta-D-heptose 7-phosphate kinase/D-beta-D-heptose 1-phosphate adenosyltransferase
VVSYKPQVVFTNGCFDLLHAGHIKFLEYAASFGELTVGLNSDISIKRIKPNRPIIDQTNRLIVLTAIKYVSKVILFDETSPLELLKIIKPYILIKGDDWEYKEDPCFDYVKSYNGKIIFFKNYNNISTTSIIEKIKGIQ